MKNSKIKYYILIILALIFFDRLYAQNQETPEETYTRVITSRADKIVDQISFIDESTKIRVRDIIVQQYRNLNDTHEKRDKEIEEIKNCNLAEGDKKGKIELIQLNAEKEIIKYHFEFLAKLSVECSPEQIDQVKDGFTYGVLPKTYQAFLEMIPSLTEVQKKQILVWLTEAREHAIDGGSSKEKHAWFGKYKGKINNYLSAEGYDLQGERKKWQKRIKENK